jgi:CTP synthase (UTP-ammonia lyase)
MSARPYTEALRQFQFRVGPDNFCLIHVSLVPVVSAVGMGLHPSVFQLNLSALYGTGGARMGHVARAKGVLGSV